MRMMLQTVRHLPLRVVFKTHFSTPCIRPFLARFLSQCFLRAACIPWFLVLLPLAALLSTSFPDTTKPVANSCDGNAFFLVLPWIVSFHPACRDASVTPPRKLDFPTLFLCLKRPLPWHRWGAFLFEKGVFFLHRKSCSTLRQHPSAMLVGWTPLGERLSPPIRAVSLDLFPPRLSQDW